jgi:peptidoglycan lytic transglycosylase D
MRSRGAKLLYLLGMALLAGSCAHVPTRTANVAPPPVPPAPQILPANQPSLAAKPASESPNVASADAVDELISKADALYAQGLKDYQSSNLEKSKQEFDAALSTLLESGIDIRGSERLNAEFEKLVDGTSRTELAAVEDGSTLSEHQYEPAPIESFANLTFPVDPNVRRRAQSELRSLRSDLPLVSNDIVDGYLTYFQGSGRNFIEKILRRRELYQPLISRVLKEQGLPQDLIYVAAGESAFNPFAVSKAGARGIWQFMYGTGKLYGLKRDRWVDDRQDPLKSTEAAAHHLKDLYQQFGDWFLAMAAYDSGSLTVQRAIERTGYANFWKLRELHALPGETENYVPIFLATALICKDPQAYGFSVEPDPPLQPDHVKVPVPTDLRLVAELIGLPVEDLIRLNPSLLRWTTPADDHDFVLNLPHGAKTRYEQAIAAIPPRNRIWWRAHTLEAGETLGSIARKFHISKASLKRANQIDDGDSVQRGDLIVLPLPPYRESLSRSYRGGPRHPLRYRIRRGDTLDAIADRFEVSVSEIRRWNHMRGSQIAAGRSLRLYVASRGPSSYHLTREKGGVYLYRVRPGDTLYRIARQVGVAEADLRRWNGLSSSRIIAGQRLKIYSRSGKKSGADLGARGARHTSQVDEVAAR